MKVVWPVIFNLINWTKSQLGSGAPKLKLKRLPCHRATSCFKLKVFESLTLDFFVLLISNDMATPLCLESFPKRSYHWVLRLSIVKLFVDKQHKSTTIPYE